ncbi:MAG: UDP-N-acetylglucosamine 2-epimerase (non-hydrolyzing) [Flavobacteriaceae bacterium]|nr:UDP-N-acetylglucosamine 2-epimerase (non-hydrolyzing) [Flavobacteriaceae bacterium]MBT6353338.1 UDP-N-acetylglucosamine 2-epimerase (non-hydrolyzing) [Pelagibacteraceae bacterium]MBT7622922.1 UDP-N-acetylglucosamine 2-epimerase (non-hydrolyzing) [Flavobacteriaceae bacterium]
MNQLRVLTIVGTRPEIIRLSRIILRLEISNSIDHKLLHTGQNYDHELNEIFFKDLGLRNPDYLLKTAGSSFADTLSEILKQTDKLLDQIKPQAVIILGDTNSALTSILAKRKKIPIFHLEAGNRCFDERVPEEINRKIVDHISDINLTYSSIAREHLIREGIKSDRIIKIGSPMKEVLNAYSKKIAKSTILNKLGLKKEKYFVLSCHREENIDLNFQKVIKIIDSVSNHYKLPIIFSAHPRTKKKIESKKIKFDPLVKLIKPLGYVDYVNLQMNSNLVISDSGTISEESSILNFNAINLRESHERPEAMENPPLVMSGLNVERVIQSIDSVLETASNTPKLVRDYNEDTVSTKVERILLSYTDYVNRVVWQKES